MDDYIRRREALSEACKGCSIDFPCEPCEPQDCEIKARLQAMPSADVVAVVRFRDCVHGEHYYGGVSCRMPSFPEWKVHEKDYFCADGERKDGGQYDG